MADLTESLEIAAHPDQVYDLVSDLPRMGEWSPECTGITWLGRHRRAVVGARFVGHNRSGWARWSTIGEVVEAERGRRFAFDITAGPVKVSRWEYTFERSPAGCVVTESWTERRPAALRRVLDALTGRREAANVRGIRATLAALRQEAERTAQPSI